MEQTHRILIAAIMLTVRPAAWAEPVIGLSDDFSDGNIHTGPTWAAGDMHWYNPFFVEKLNGKYWAGSKRYGSMGAAFTDPNDRSWPIAFDIDRGPVTFSMTVLFRTTTSNDHLSVALIGDGGRIHVNYFPNGRLLVTIKSSWKQDNQVVQFSSKAPAAQAGQPVHLEATIGGSEKLTIRVNQTPSFARAPSKRSQIDSRLGPFRRIAMMGALNVQERNVHMLIPEMQDTEALRWVADVRVTGWPETVRISDAPEIKAAEKTALVFAGLASLRLRPILSLRQSEWIVRDVLINSPLKSDTQRVVQQAIRLDSLTRHQWVVLCDVDLRHLGSIGCQYLTEYVRRGGRLMILASPRILEHGGYLNGPLSAILPMTPNRKPKADATPLNGSLSGWQRSHGLGIASIVILKIAGKQPQPFQSQTDWLPSLLTTASPIK